MFQLKSWPHHRRLWGETHCNRCTKSSDCGAAGERQRTRPVIWQTRSGECGCEDDKGDSEGLKGNAHGLSRMDQLEIMSGEEVLWSFYQHADKWLRGWTEGRRHFTRRMDGQLVASNAIPAVVYSTRNKNLMANNKTNSQSLYLWADKYLAFHCQPFIVSFIKAACFLWAIHSALRLCIPHSPLCLFIIPHLSLGSLFLSFPLWLALLCISYAGFEAISVCDYYQTRPEEKVEG